MGRSNVVIFSVKFFSSSCTFKLISKEHEKNTTLLRQFCGEMDEFICLIGRTSILYMVNGSGWLLQKYRTTNNP